MSYLSMVLMCGCSMHDLILLIRVLVPWLGGIRKDVIFSTAYDSHSPLHLTYIINAIGSCIHLVVCCILQ